VNKVWDFMDSDHSGTISFADFSSGLKVAQRVLAEASGAAGAGGGGDLEEGGGGAAAAEKATMAAAQATTRAAWDKVHAAIQRSGLDAADFFGEKLDMDHAGDLDLAEFAEALGSLGLVRGKEG